MEKCGEMEGFGLSKLVIDDICFGVGMEYGLCVDFLFV